MDVPLFKGEHKEVCSECFGKGVLLCCDYCSLSYHPHCANPPVYSQPEEYWMCPQCVSDLKFSNGKELISVRCKEESFLHSDLDYPLLEVKNEDRVHIKGENGNKKGHIFTSGFRGVYSRGDKWNAQIQYNGKKVYLGSYSSEEEAARAYDIAAKRYHGNKAILNFHNHENGCIRNPYQVNSKPTSRRGSHLSLTSDYSEMNLEMNGTQSHIQPITNEGRIVDSSSSFIPKLTPIIFAEDEESKQLLASNREVIASCL